MRYQSTTGLDEGQFAELVARISQLLAGRPHGAGRPEVLGLAKQLQILLLLLRQNLNQMAVGDMFGVSQPTVSRIYRRMMPLLEEVVCLHSPPFPQVWERRTVLVDGTDVPTGNRTGARENYSGKRKRQGLLIQLSCDLTGVLLAVSDPLPGCRHDRRAINETGWEAILDTVNWIADPGYQGTTAITPMKKPRGYELTDDRKHNNKVISGLRSAVERCIAHLKNWKILATGYRGRLNELPNVIRIITRLENYRLGW